MTGEWSRYRQAGRRQGGKPGATPRSRIVLPQQPPSAIRRLEGGDPGATPLQIHF
jgi:hypothetical protein